MLVHRISFRVTLETNLQLKYVFLHFEFIASILVSASNRTRFVSLGDINSTNATKRERNKLHFVNRQF